MKLIKIFCLAALAALMVMAFVGASSAMAESTSLCKEDAVVLPSEVCPEAKRISHVHEVTLPGNPMLLLTVVEVLCDLLFLGDVQNATNLGNPLEILGHFTYSNCMTPTTPCTVTEVSGTDANLKILKLGHELADVSYADEKIVHCGIFVNCTYSGEGLLSHVLGPLLASESNGQTRIEEQIMHRIGGFSCPETAKLDILTTPLEATYIAK